MGLKLCAHGAFGAIHAFRTAKLFFKHGKWHLHIFVTSEIKECTANAANRSHRQFLLGIGFVCMVKLGGVRFKRLYHYNTATEMLIGLTNKYELLHLFPKQKSYLTELMFPAMTRSCYLF